MEVFLRYFKGLLLCFHIIWISIQWIIIVFNGCCLCSGNIHLVLLNWIYIAYLVDFCYVYTLEIILPLEGTHDTLFFRHIGFILH